MMPNPKGYMRPRFFQKNVPFLKKVLCGKVSKGQYLTNRGMNYEIVKLDAIWAPISGPNTWQILFNTLNLSSHFGDLTWQNSLDGAFCQVCVHFRTIHRTNTWQISFTFDICQAWGPELGVMLVKSWCGCWKWQAWEPETVIQLVKPHHEWKKCQAGG